MGYACNVAHEYVRFVVRSITIMDRYEGFYGRVGSRSNVCERVIGRSKCRRNSDLPGSASGREPAVAEPRLARTYQAARTA